jgi:predicted dienelactone hydrolase
VSVGDRRIRAVVALAPMAVVFTPESLAAITVPVRVIMAEHDAVLNGVSDRHKPATQGSAYSGHLSG